MGILDDAIREHLELKRQHGAGSEDLERLENEAFGAPARPGDPEFAEGEADAAQAVAAEPETTVAEPEGERGSTSDWLAGIDETDGAPSPQPETDAEHARAEHPLLDDTADHPAPEPEPSEPSFEEPGPPSGGGPDEGAGPPEAPESSIFDADEVDLGEFDLDLDREEESPAAAEPSAPSEPLPPDRPAEVRRDPVFEDDTSEAPAPVAPRPEEDEEDEGDEPEGEDLLGETPDFLQEAPEGEDLWFEQGPPKDFDFDDED
jgi:hypothetical protein